MKITIEMIEYTQRSIIFGVSQTEEGKKWTGIFLSFFSTFEW